MTVGVRVSKPKLRGVVPWNRCVPGRQPSASTDGTHAAAVCCSTRLLRHAVAGEGKPPYLEDPESAKQAVEVSDDGGNSTGIIAGFAALVIAAAGGTWYYLRRRRSNSDLTAH